MTDLVVVCVTSEATPACFSCQLCDYRTRTQQNLTVHLRKHTGDAPYVCYLCQAAFKMKSDLTRHMRVHSGERPHKCAHCDYACALKSTRAVQTYLLYSGARLPDINQFRSHLSTFTHFTFPQLGNSKKVTKFLHLPVLKT